MVENPYRNELRFSVTERARVGTVTNAWRVVGRQVFQNRFEGPPVGRVPVGNAVQPRKRMNVCVSRLAG